MTVALSGKEIASQVEKEFPGCVVEAGKNCLVLKADSLLSIAAFLKNTESLKFDYLNYITAVDYYSYFEVIYQFTSLEHNHSLVLKTRCHDRENPVVPSIVGLWQGADFQEREVYDLMGIRFEGHPNLKRILTWDGFPGHPLRKDWNR